MFKKLICLGVVTLFLSGCETMEGAKSSLSNLFSSSDRQMAAACPKFMISDELSNYYEIPEDSAPNTALTYSNANLEKISGACSYNDTKDMLIVSLDLSFSAQPGPFAANTEAEGEEFTVPYFIAVLDEHQEILAKDMFSVPFEMKASGIEVRYDEQLQQTIPVEEGKAPASYTIIAGFQLNDTQLAYAKTQKSALQLNPAAGEVQMGADPFAGQ